MPASAQLKKRATEKRNDRTKKEDDKDMSWMSEGGWQQRRATDRTSPSTPLKLDMKPVREQRHSSSDADVDLEASTACHAC